MQAGEGGLGLIDQHLGVRYWQVPQAASKVDEILRFAQGTARNVKEMQIIALSLPRRTFNDVGTAESGKRKFVSFLSALVEER
jgi:hypothetical protein